MQFDLTITVTAILGISAIISPIATAIINNLFQLKTKKLETEQMHLVNTTYYVRSIFENYLRHAGMCISNADGDARKDYGEYYFLAIAYAPDNVSSAMIDINDAISTCDYQTATSLLEKLNPEINKLLQKL